jgi:hypothetical protein
LWLQYSAIQFIPRLLRHHQRHGCYSDHSMDSII